MTMNQKLILTLALSTLLLLTAPLPTRADDSAGSSPGAAASTLLPWQGQFTYTDGTATGTYCHFTIDPTTGTISDFTIRLTRYPQVTIPPAVYPPGKGNETTTPDNYNSTTQTAPTPDQTPEILNATIFTSIAINDFTAVGEPTPYANILTIHGTNALMLIYDQEGGTLNYFAGQHPVQLTFTLPEGTIVTQQDNSYAIESDKTLASNPAINPWHDLQLTTDDIVTSLTLAGGNITTTNQTVTITLDPYGTLTSYSWINYPVPDVINDYWYNDLNIQDNKTMIDNAIATGVIPAEGWCTGNFVYTNAVKLPDNMTGNLTEVQGFAPTPVPISNCYHYNDPSFNMTFDNISHNAVDVIVDSQIPTGRIIIINLQRSVLNATSISDILVSIDNADIPAIPSLETLMTMVENKDTTGAYYPLMGENLVSVFVYIPHFSTHIVSIKTLTSPLPMLTSGIVPVVLAAVFLTAIVLGFVVQRRKPYE